MTKLSPDARRIIAAQGLRAAGFGCTSVLLGGLLAARSYSPLTTGLVLACVVAGTAWGSLVLGRIADRVGRRRWYAAIYGGVAAAGLTMALGPPLWLIVVLGLTGVLSTDVVDNGPATTLEQVMLAGEDAAAAGRSGAHVYGIYNAVASITGALGALAAGIPAQLGIASADTRSFALLIPIGLAGLVLALRLSPRVEASDRGSAASGRLGDNRSKIRQLATLFAVDAGGGGLVTTSFLAYYLAVRYDASVESLGVLFFSTSLLQAASVWLAPRLADRIGLVPTMVWTHLPSNVLLAAIAFAATLPVAVVLILARTALSQMDVPTRQALVMSVVAPEQRTAAAAVTNAARYTVRPAGPLIGGALQSIALGLPLVVAGIVKGSYDLALWTWARTTPRGSNAPSP
jgi:MFS family permease